MWLAHAMLTPLRKQLMNILRTEALYRLDQPIQLASGAWSSDFVDAKKALATWQNLRIASEAIVESLAPESGYQLDSSYQFDAVGGPTTGADALAVGIAAVSNSQWFFVRKEPKGRGTQRLIEGAQIGPGCKVLLIDDVVTTGGSIFRAFETVNETGAEIVAAVTLVDRSGLAQSRFKNAGVHYIPMTTYASLDIEPVNIQQLTSSS